MEIIYSCHKCGVREGMQHEERCQYTNKAIGTNTAAIPQPTPIGQNNEVLPLVIEDLKARSQFGETKYGTTLRIFNGRDALMDAYQEALDLVMYLRQEIEERKNGRG